VTRQAQLVGISRSSAYYQPRPELWSKLVFG
jgi:hypothetical protein